MQIFLVGSENYNINPEQSGVVLNGRHFVL